MTLNTQFRQGVRPDWQIELEKGNISGHEHVQITATNPDIDTSSEETVWTYGGIYTHISNKSGVELFLSSSDAADSGNTIKIHGIRFATDEQTTHAEVVITGQTPVTAGIWYRVFEIKNVTLPSIEGDVYLAESDTVVAGVPSTPSKVKLAMIYDTQLSRSHNIAHYPGFTAPKGYFLLLNEVHMSGAKSKDLTYSVMIRESTETADAPWEDASPWEVYETDVMLPYHGTVIDELWDVEIRAHTDTNNSAATVVLDVLLIKKD